MTHQVFESMDNMTIDILGGHPRDMNDDWGPSVFRNPAVINFALQNIADLILDPDKAVAVQAEVDARMTAAVVNVNHKAQIMFNFFGSVEDDHGSGSKMGKSEMGAS